MRGRVMDFLIRAAGAAFLLFLLAGCGNMRPRLFGPGRIDEQRLNATYHDPYADNTAGPEVVGGRPRDYMEQRPEAVRDQPYQNRNWAPYR